MSNEPTPEGASPGLDLSFIHRVYRTSLVVALLGALLIWESRGVPSLLGWLWGVALSLLALASLEWSIRHFIRPGTRSAGSLVGIMLVKMVVIAVILALAFVAALRGWIALPWVLAGFTLPHAVVALKLVGQKVRTLGADEGRRPRR